METIKITGATNTFTVQTSFVDKYIKDVNPSFFKVYIYIARHLNSQKELTIDTIAEDTGLLKSDVVASLKFWDKKGVISYTSSSIHLLELTDDKSAQAPTENKQNEQKKPSHLLPNTSVASSYKAANVIKTVTSDEKLANLFAIISQLLNKSLSSNDYKIIYSFIDYLKLPEQVIIVLFEYCVSISQTNMRYIEKVAYSWADNGINTPERAVEHVSKLSYEQSVFSSYKKKFKIQGRDFSDFEAKLLISWLNELKATEELIMHAYETSVMNTGKISFKYMDAVIRSELSGTADDKNARLSSNIRKSSFRNYPSDRSVGEIEKKMIEKMMSKFGGEEDAINQ